MYLYNHARRGLPVTKMHQSTPPNIGPVELHDTAAKALEKSVNNSLVSLVWIAEKIAESQTFFWTACAKQRINWLSNSHSPKSLSPTALTIGSTIWVDVKIIKYVIEYLLT